MPEAVVGWRARRGARWGGGVFYIYKEMIYYTPIWDVLAPQGEREEAGERLYGARFAELSELGKRCQWACLGSVLLLGSLGSVFYLKKSVL